MGALIDLSGQRFGHWTVLYLDNDVHKKGCYWKCKCDCGTLRSVAGTSLRSGISVSCGCGRGRRIKDLTGQHYGSLVVLRQDENNRNDHKGARWICKCECGNEVSVLSGQLRSGQTRSCGCQTHTKKIDLVGKRFGRWTVLREDNTKPNKKKAYICRCDCGTIRSVESYTLSSGLSRSCGCGRSNPSEDLVGRKFGKLTVLSADNEKYGTGIWWRCKCECGTESSYKKSLLLGGKVTSCGCESRH